MRKGMQETHKDAGLSSGTALQVLHFFATKENFKLQLQELWSAVCPVKVQKKKEKKVKVKAHQVLLSGLKSARQWFQWAIIAQRTSVTRSLIHITATLIM